MGWEGCTHRHIVTTTYIQTTTTINKRASKTSDDGDDAHSRKSRTATKRWIDKECVSCFSYRKSYRTISRSRAIYRTLFIFTIPFYSPSNSQNLQQEFVQVINNLIPVKEVLLYSVPSNESIEHGLTQVSYPYRQRHTWKKRSSLYPAGSNRKSIDLLVSTVDF